MSGATRSAVSDAAGRWSVALPSFRAGGPYQLNARTSSRGQQLKDVLVGDVWLCSGQSNMEWKVRNSLNAQSEVQHSANDTIRHVTIPRFAAAGPAADFAGRLEWQVAGPATTPDFSAVCYFFARELQKAVNVPQGLINSSWGGTRIETWLSAQALRQLGGTHAKLDLLGAYSADPALPAPHAGAASGSNGGPSQPVTQGVQPWTAGKAAGEWQRVPELTQWENWGIPALHGYDGLVLVLRAGQAQSSAGETSGQDFSGYGL